MFKKSELSTAGDLFDSYAQRLSGAKLDKLEDPQGWYNQFFGEITSQIDETIFSVLYHDHLGRPNASIRRLVAMLILKDGQDWTDEQLFEAVNFNILVGRALGLSNLSDEAPCAATYYNFKVALLQHYQVSGEDLLKKCFQQITAGQVLRYAVSGKQVRLDSKLLHANVHSGTRLSLCLEVLRKFYRGLSAEQCYLLEVEDVAFFKDLFGQSVSQYTYRLDKSATTKRLQQCGKVVYRLRQLFAGQAVAHYDLLERIWTDHFECITSEGSTSSDQSPAFDPPKQTVEIELKEVSNQKGTTLQSAHDAEATYRNKAGSKKQVVVGYVSNITESCDEPAGEQTESPLRLITDVQTEAVTHSDDKFFIPAIQNTQQVTGQAVEAALSDGAYNSPENLAFTRRDDQPIEWYLTAIQGAAPKYDFEIIDEKTYRVTDRINGRVQTSHLTPKGNHRIENDHGKSKYYYIRPETIDNYFRRQQIEKIPAHFRGLRANCEATINQVFNNLDGAKTKYRGLFQHRTYALCRCFWTNLTRIRAKNAFLLYIQLFCPVILHLFDQRRNRIYQILFT